MILIIFVVDNLKRKGKGKEKEPPIGNLGLPVTNFKKSFCCEGVKPIIIWIKLWIVGLSRVNPWSALILSLSTKVRRKEEKKKRRKEEKKIAMNGCLFVFKKRKLLSSVQISSVPLISTSSSDGEKRRISSRGKTVENPCWKLSIWVWMESNKVTWTRSYFWFLFFFGVKKFLLFYQNLPSNILQGYEL